MTKLKRISRAVGTVVAALIIAGLVFLFFTNDFGLVDLRKTSVVVGVGLDREGEELVLTAQLALPQAAENGEKTQYSNIVGKGATVAEALNEINVRTGFYPKLVFCELILLGESALDENLFATLDYFYRNEYTGLTPKVALCKSAGEALSANLPLGDSATDSIMRLLSEEAERSANVCTVDLRDIGGSGYSKGAFCYMPYISFDENRELQKGGESSGDSQQKGGGSGQQKSDESGGSGQQKSGESGGSGQGKQAEKQGFVCNRCALFSEGKYAGTLDEKQTFAFNLINSQVRHALIRCGSGEELRVFGLRDCKGGVRLAFEGDLPVVRLSFSAIVRVQDGDRQPTPASEGRKQVSDGEIALCTSQLESEFADLFDGAKQLSCDLFNVRGMLYKYYNDKYSALSGGILSSVVLRTDINLRSAA